MQNRTWIILFLPLFSIDSKGITYLQRVKKFALSVFIYACICMINYGQNISFPKDKSLVGKTVALNPEELLLYFFPGKLYTEVFDGDSCTYVLWSCSSCDTLKFESWLEKEYYISFPENELTETRYKGLRYFTENNEKKVIVFFDSHPASYCEPSGSRSACVVLGAAILKEKDNQWIVEGFNPAVGCYGSFNMSTVPYLFTDSLAGEVYWIMKDENGWNGGHWSIAHYHFFSSKDGFLSPVDILMHVDFLSGENEWSSGLVFKMIEEKPFIQIETKGYIHKISDLPKSQELPKGIQQVLAKLSNGTSFHFVTTYSLDKNGSPVFVSIKNLPD
jgi:hypothetical protein